MMNMLVIGGSSPTGCAGIEADVKTAAAHGLNAAVAITSIASQNTMGVTNVFYLPVETVAQQLKAVFSDMGISAVKTGMLGNAEISGLVFHHLAREKARNIVVDPVMTAQADGSWLVERDSIGGLRKLISLAAIVTPNRFEAEQLTGVEIKSIADMKAAAEELAKLGASAVVIKGFGEKGKIVDILYSGCGFEVYSKDRRRIGTHGGGCSFSTSLAANLAKGLGVKQAFESSERFIEMAIAGGRKIGKGIDAVEPLAGLYENSERYNVLNRLKEALEIIERSPEVAALIPEVGMNIVYSLADAKGVGDVAGVVGRIRKAKGYPKSLGIVEFGASTHLASAVLKMLEFEKGRRAAINIAYSDENVKKLKKLGMKIASAGRESEPRRVKEAEGASMPWAVAHAVKSSKSIPDAILHGGGFGKEPMIIIFSKGPMELADAVKKVAGAF